MTPAMLHPVAVPARPRLAVFGATRGIGRHLLEMAVEAGHPVTALARDGSSLSGIEGVTVVEGDVTDPVAVRRALAGANAVMVALGAPALSRSTVRSEGTRQIVEAMEEAGIERVVCVSVYGAAETRETLPFFLRYLVFPLYLRRVVIDHERQERILEQSDLRWTIVRPPTLTDGPRTEGYVHGDSLDPQALTLKISRRDVAAFMLAQLDSDAYVRRHPGISA